ncbi:nicotinate phosphoribosyltransferase, partial [Amphibiibacter pelophylacis]
MHEPVFDSLLETDLYKFTMWQALLHRHPQTRADYRFVCRNTPAFPLAELAGDINAELDHLCSLRFRKSELDFLQQLRFIKPDFVDFLRIFQFQREFIRVWTEDDQLRIEASGPQVHVMAFEVFVLATVNELYFRRLHTPDVLAEGRRRLATKIARVQQFARLPRRRHPFEFFDFGLRRRYSRAWHEEVVRTLQAELPGCFKGTSNPWLAQRVGLTPMGTMGHEYLQAYQANGVRLRDFQRTALEDWVQEYRGDLGIALTDVVGMDAFLGDFDLYFAKLFDGLRHDSGDPFVWADKALAHYAQMRIDPHTKRLVFSDGLNFDRVFALYERYADHTQLGFGVGTHLTNDMGLQPLSIVMKLVRCNGQAVAKISDEPGKVLCDNPTFLSYL